VVELKPDDVRTLVDLGFLAVSYGLSDKAAPIFAAVRATRPTQEAGFIGGALVSLARGEIDGAISALRALPPTDAGRTFLAIALNRSGDREAAREILTDVVNSAPGTPYATLARQLLEDAEKSPAPLFR
jgi:thioredoxin-like negative regulator of GroEL